jgi:hypothetical protein
MTHAQGGRNVFSVGDRLSHHTERRSVNLRCMDAFRRRGQVQSDVICNCVPVHREGLAILPRRPPHREKTSIGIPKASRRGSASGKKRPSASVKYVSCSPSVSRPSRNAAMRSL